MRVGERMGRIRDLIWEEDAVGVVEIILILVAIFTHHYSMEKTCIR